jgi:coenzyme F420-reducing hydrogenase alpha subunit
MGEIITIAPTTRNEGHGKFVLQVDDEVKLIPFVGGG